MESTFFQQISPLITDCTLKMVIKKGDNGQLIVSVLVTTDKVGDDAKDLIAPLISRGTPESLDEGFFQAISAPVKEIDTLLIGMEIYAKQVEIAKQNSKSEKDKIDAEKKSKEERKKKFEALMKKVDELEAEGKLKEALEILQKATDLTEHTEDVKKRIVSFQQKSQTSIF